MEPRRPRARLALAGIGAVATVALLSSAAPAATVMFGNSEYGGAYIQTAAYANANVGNKANSGSDTEYLSAASLPSLPLAVEADADASAVKAGLGSASASDTETATATFANAGSGSVDFLGSTSVNAIGASSSATAYNNNDYFQYGFSALSNGLFTTSFNLTDDENSGYYSNIYLYDYTLGQQLIGENLYDMSTGKVSANLTKGDDYLLQIYGSYSNDYLYQSGTGNQSASRDDHYAFNVTSAVPEAATWAMMILGFGVIGGVMRRQHRVSEEAFTRKVRAIAAV